MIEFIARKFFQIRLLIRVFFAVHNAMHEGRSNVRMERIPAPQNSRRAEVLKHAKSVAGIAIRRSQA